MVVFPAMDAAPTATGSSTPPLVELSEKMRKAGALLTATAEFVGFDVNDRETPERDAIARAAENALYHAEAVGELLDGQVTSADHVTIVETRWEGLDAANGSLTNPPSVACVARVRISYRYSPAPR